MHWCRGFVWAGLLAVACASADPVESAQQAFARAVVLQRAGDFEAAIREYRAALAQEPANFEARSNLGVALAISATSKKPLRPIAWRFKASPRPPLTGSSQISV